MRYALLLALVYGSTAFAEQKKSEPAAVLRDVRLVCELSKLGQSLLTTPEFKNDQVTVAAKLSAMLDASLTTWEAKAAYSGLRMGDRNSKREGWKKLAKDYGAKTWDCPSLSEIGG